MCPFAALKNLFNLPYNYLLLCKRDLFVCHNCHLLSSKSFRKRVGSLCGGSQDLESVPAFPDKLSVRFRTPNMFVLYLLRFCFVN